MAYLNNTKVTNLTTPGSGTWTADPRTKYVKVILIGGGAGGGSGRKGTTALSAGGNGGAGGQVAEMEGPVAYFAGTVSYTVAASVGGGLAQATDATNGNPGTAGNNTVFGNIIALGGALGIGGSTSLGTSTAVQNELGTFAGIAYTSLGFNSGGSGGNVNGNNGGIIGSVTRAYANTGSGGGGSGGDIVTARQAGNGGAPQDASGAFIIAGATGGIETGTINGANAVSTVLVGSFSAGYGGGGGGGAKSGSTGGTGGNGSAPGGGGGGGGGGISAQANSGAGGTGAAGQITIIESF